MASLRGLGTWVLTVPVSPLPFLAPLLTVTWASVIVLPRSEAHTGGFCIRDKTQTLQVVIQCLC